MAGNHPSFLRTNQLLFLYDNLGLKSARALCGSGGLNIIYPAVLNESLWQELIEIL